VPAQDTAEPLPLFGDRVMASPFEFVLDLVQLAAHPFGDRDPLSMNRPFLVFEQQCLKPRKSNVSGLPRPRLARLRAANRPNSISRVLSDASSRLNFASLSRRSARNWRASRSRSNPTM